MLAINLDGCKLHVGNMPVKIYLLVQSHLEVGICCKSYPHCNDMIFMLMWTPNQTSDSAGILN